MDLAAEMLGFGPVAWFVEHEKYASAVLDFRFPDVPNHGDATTVVWERVAPVDVVTAGYPCQPFSVAGRRGGHADKRHIWPHIRCALRVLQPRLVLLENVPGHLSLGFDRVLADLATDGYDIDFLVFPASAVGAPHRRERLFIAAQPAVSPPPGGDPLAHLVHGAWEPAQGRLFTDTTSLTLPRAGYVRAGQLFSRTSDESSEDSSVLLPTPTPYKDGRSPERYADMKRSMLGGPRSTVTLLSIVARQAAMTGEWTNRLLPSPTAGDAKASRNATATRLSPTNAHTGTTLTDAITLLPTPTVSDSTGPQHSPSKTGGPSLREKVASTTNWGPFTAAIERWEGITGLPVPTPADAKGRLNPPFVEWMFGLEPGWVTDAPIPRTAKLRVLGNMVLPRQAVAAYSELLGIRSVLGTVRSERTTLRPLARAASHTASVTQLTERGC